jgi:hypothetical protein
MEEREGKLQVEEKGERRAQCLLGLLDEVRAEGADSLALRDEKKGSGKWR